MFIQAKQIHYKSHVTVPLNSKGPTVIVLNSSGSKEENFNSASKAYVLLYPHPVASRLVASGRDKSRASSVHTYSAAVDWTDRFLCPLHFLNCRNINGPSPAKVD